MNRIPNAFKDGKAFIGFITAGDPDIKKTEDFICEMVKSGTDLIEIGIPFSDPIAEGPVIQAASVRALSKKINVDDIFDAVENVRKKNDKTPIVFMTYINPVYKYGYDMFFRHCQKSGVDGIIIPDLPFEEKKEVLSVSKKYDVTLISMIAPTSDKRIEDISSEAEGFIYLVSSMGVTGIRSEIKTDLESIIKVIRNVTDIPVAVGFGINTPQQVEKISKISDGIIVGSAIVKIIERYGENADSKVSEYIKSMKSAMK